MPIITLTTEINAPPQRCFDLSRSIDLHKICAHESNEKAIDGKTFGLISLNESVTWEAKHFGFKQRLTSKITHFDEPHRFVDEMTKGIFKSIYHKHLFAEIDGKTVMGDYFEYVSPFGLLGKLADVLFLKTYLRNMLIKRNQIIKQFAESDRWKDVPHIN